MNPDVSIDEGSGLVRRVTGIGVAAHELKSPLVLLRQLSLELADDALTEHERARIAVQMTLVTEKALRLTSDLTRVESQTKLFELTPVNPLDVARDVRSELQSLYSAHGRLLRVSRIHTLPPVIANRDLLRRILLNFADNALHYTGPDDVVELQAQLLADRSSVRLSIRDYGPHMPLANWKRLVTTLSDKQSVHSRPQSSGLGLYISHEFARHMNGRIGAIRHQDGASFYVELPVSRQLSLL
ncbi:HAMP domain-containing histidine kinase [Candidatus Saccharibacteria bacterium]|nr:HAMP domain-containing histidine kinase [Candidatus Saccharibacteria bacterium]